MATSLQGRRTAHGPKGRLLNVEAGRGIAASMVVAYHADKYYFGTSDYWHASAFGRLFSFGNAGVEFFFVLSGFIIAFIHWGDLGRTGKVRPFLQKRFTRLFPFYWLCLAAAVLVFVAVPSFGEAKNRELWNIVSSVVLVGSDPHNAVIFVSWTLYHEVLFYALAAVAIWRPRLGLPVIGAWTLLSLLSGIFDWGVPYPLASVNVLFAVGVGVALLVRHHSIPAPRLVLASGAVLFLATGLDQVYVQWAGGLGRTLLYGAATALLLLGGVEAERSGRLAAPRVMVLLGEASYSVYVTHMLTLAFAAKVAARLGLDGSLPADIGFVGLAGAAIVSGVAVHKLVEAPVIDIVRTRLSKTVPAPLGNHADTHTVAAAQVAEA